MHGGPHGHSAMAPIPPTALVSLRLFIFLAFGWLTALVPMIKAQLYCPSRHQIHYPREVLDSITLE